MLSGEQIWIYHDSVTNPCNPITCCFRNTYAHVVIYVGVNRGVREVVHIKKASWTKGVMKAKIKKENVNDVIKPGDQIFLGHQLPSFQFSANLRDKIAERAKKCCDKNYGKSIVFDYDYRYGFILVTIMSEFMVSILMVNNCSQFV